MTGVRPARCLDRCAMRTQPTVAKSNWARTATNTVYCVFNDGMVYYSGIWYGDWSIFPASTFASSNDLQTRLQQFDEERAVFGFIVKEFSGAEELRSISRFDNEDDAINYATAEHLRLQNAVQYGYTVVVYECGPYVQGNCAEVILLEVD